MELKRTRKKTALLVISAALVVVLAVTGTLMLFTAQTKTATNVVTLDGLNITLQETDQSDGTGYWDVDKDNEYDFFGPSGKTVVPGDTIDKSARIANKSDIPAYAFVKVVFTIKDEDGLIDFTKQVNRDKYFGTGADILTVAAFFNEFASSMNVGENWHAKVMEPSEIFDFANATAKCGYFYVEGPANVAAPTSAAKTLKALPGGKETSPVFDKVIIPASIKGDAWAGVTFSLDVKGYAVQSENNPYEGTGKERTVAFGELKDEIGLW